MPPSPTKETNSVKLPGFLTPLGLKLAGAALLLVLIMSVFGGNQLFSAGSLSAVNRTGGIYGGVKSHAELATNCAACHTAPWISLSMNDRCTACHTDIQTELHDPGSLHGLLAATNCRDCHTEHQGSQGYLTQMARQEVDHSWFGFGLAKHQVNPQKKPFACNDCHTQRLTVFEPSRCETCHRSYQEPFVTTHVSQFGSDCRACHDGTDTFSKDKFDHNKLSFPLLGKHAQVQCVNCHLGVTNMAGFKSAPTNCVGCHLKDNIHQANFGTDCARCHNSEGWQTEIFDHNLASFKLTGKHTEVPCAQCHVNRVFKGTPTTCVACHAKDDVHRGLFGTECQACHTTATWKRSPIEHTFPLNHGGFGTIGCATCHTQPDNYKIYTCYNCHDREDIRRQHAFAEMMNTDISNCARCHPTGQKTMRMH